MTQIDDLLSYLAASPSPYHAVAESVDRLTARGFVELGLLDRWPDGPGRYLVRRGGALVAWHVPEGAEPSRPLALVGAHTDSPNLRVKPHPSHSSVGWRQLGVEVYGGALWNSWLDRDLGLSGRVSVLTEVGVDEHLVLIDRPLARISQLAIHLDRDVNGQGLKLNPQQHLTPTWGLGRSGSSDFHDFLARELGLDGEVVGWDLMFHDLTPPGLLGEHRDLLVSARLDNLLSCWAAVEALASIVSSSDTAAPTPADPHQPVAVVCLYDHEEVGSTSATGADGALLVQVLERTILARGGDRDDVLRAYAGSMCVSADGAHATHPNHPERHDPAHHVTPGEGPVIKVNANQRYATDATTDARLQAAARRADVPLQWFVSRNDQPCGSTIGPLTAARLGIDTIDLGVAQLSMHSAREVCAAADPPLLVDLLQEFLEPDREPTT